MLSVVCGGHIGTHRSRRASVLGHFLAPYAVTVPLKVRQIFPAVFLAQDLHIAEPMGPHASRTLGRSLAPSPTTQRSRGSPLSGTLGTSTILAHHAVPVAGGPNSRIL